MPDSIPSNQAEALAQVVAENVARAMWNEVERMRIESRNKLSQADLLYNESKVLKEQADHLERAIARWAEKSPLTAKFQNSTWSR